MAHKAAKERERKAAYRARVSQNVPRDNDGTSAGRPAQRDVTGRDVTGREVKLGGVEQAPPKPKVKPMALRPDNLTDDEWNVFEHWRQATGKRSAMLSPERLALIRRWLATPGITVERLQAALEAWDDGSARTVWSEAAPYIVALYVGDTAAPAPSTEDEA